jgi:threonine synthase
MAHEFTSRIIDLVCPECRKHFPADKVQTYCKNCQSPLLAVYDLAQVSKELTGPDIGSRPSGIWRWSELLPVSQASYRLTLGEGDTPLLSLPSLGKITGLQDLYIKDDGLNPTGSFKARGLAVALARALQLGITAFVIPTAGNAGGALAAYAAHAGAEAHVYMPIDAPKVNQMEVQLAGADLHLVDGLISDAARVAAKDAQNAGWFDVSTFKEPYRLEGKKTMGFELAEVFDWHLPDVILYPTGGGTGLVGMWKAFDELEGLGWIGPERPRMVSVQAQGCSPIVRAFHSGAKEVKPWENAHTIAAGLRVPSVFAGKLILHVLYESHGTAEAVSDEEILLAQDDLARNEGILASPEGAATLAALRHLINRRWIRPSERVVLYNTGNGLKYV